MHCILRQFVFITITTFIATIVQATLSDASEIPSKDDKDTCVGWLSRYGYDEEKVLSNYEKAKNREMEKKNSPNFDEDDFYLVCQYTTLLTTDQKFGWKTELPIVQLKTSDYCNGLKLDNEMKLEFFTKNSKFTCKDWIHKYGYSDDLVANCDKARGRDKYFDKWLNKYVALYAQHLLLNNCSGSNIDQNTESQPPSTAGIDAVVDHDVNGIQQGLDEKKKTESQPLCSGSKCSLILLGKNNYWTNSSYDELKTCEKWIKKYYYTDDTEKNWLKASRHTLKSDQRISIWAANYGEHLRNLKEGDKKPTPKKYCSQILGSKADDLHTFSSLSQDQNGRGEGTSRQEDVDLEEGL